MRAAADLLKFRWNHCVAHMIILVVTKAIDAVPEVKQSIVAVQSIVTYFKHNVTAQAKVEDARRLYGEPILKLIHSVPTRWNSTWAMVERYLELAPEVSRVQVGIGAAPPVLQGEELIRLRGIVDILKPFKVNISTFIIRCIF